MPARRKGRAPFDFEGRTFVWHVADDVLLRISSLDKQFSVAYELIGSQPLLAIQGPEFLGVPRSVQRPAWIVPPDLANGVGVGARLVHNVLTWCFDVDHEIVPYQGPSATTVQRAWDSGADNKERSSSSQTS